MSYVTILTFANYLDASPVKTRLENEGISCYLKDEHTVTAAPYLANYVGGIKLQVWRDDYLKAIELLEDAGYKISKYPEYKQHGFWYWFNERTRSLPLIGGQPVYFRFLYILIPICLLAILLLLSIYDKGA